MERRICLEGVQLLLRSGTRTQCARITTCPLVRRHDTSRSVCTTPMNAPLASHRNRRRDVQHHGTQNNDIGTTIGIRSTQPILRRRYAAPTPNKPNLEALLTRVGELAESAVAIENGRLPTEQRVLYVLEQLDAIAHSLLDVGAISEAPPGQRESTPNSGKDTTATSALLGSVNARRHAAFWNKDSLLQLISEHAENILRHPCVFITPGILSTYIGLQSYLHQPTSFPEIFTLYASKPIPSVASTTTTQSNLKFSAPNPSAAKAAVPSATADLALTSAITAHNLPLAIDVINTTFTTPAFNRNKLLRHALMPAALVTTFPLAAYALAQQFALVQTTMSPSYATGVAFAGFLTYLGTVTGLGYVVVTTANDQMDRVTWAKGVPLWERWVREEERAAWDRVAGAWGFRERERRGEEEGDDWEALREEVGVRGMVLDAAELMDGME